MEGELTCRGSDPQMLMKLLELYGTKALEISLLDLMILIKYYNDHIHTHNYSTALAICS